MYQWQLALVIITGITLFISVINSVLFAVTVPGWYRTWNGSSLMIALFSVIAMMSVCVSAAIMKVFTPPWDEIFSVSFIPVLFSQSFRFYVLVTNSNHSLPKSHTE